MRNETHKEYSRRVLGKTPAIYCASWHMTFGGKCLNCGWVKSESSDVVGLEVDHHDHLYIVKEEIIKITY
jgi:hypothetical protein